MGSRVWSQNQATSASFIIPRFCMTRSDQLGERRNVPGLTAPGFLIFARSHRATVLRLYSVVKQCIAPPSFAYRHAALLDHRVRRQSSGTNNTSSPGATGLAAAGLLQVALSLRKRISRMQTKGRTRFDVGCFSTRNTSGNTPCGARGLLKFSRPIRAGPWSEKRRKFEE